MGVNLVPVNLVAITTLVQPTVSKWVNEYGQVLKFECPVGEHVSRLESQYNTTSEDRGWYFECRKGPVTEKCKWTDYQNVYDQAFNFQCEDNGLIAGLMSYHSNYHGDRSWQFKCCSVS